MHYLLTLIIGAHLVLARPLEEETEVIRQPAVNATEFSYQVLISQYEDSPKCGAVLVDEGFILTSATCVLDFGGIKKFLEEAVLYGGGTSLLMDLGAVADAVIHPKYTVNPTLYDVALVKYVPDGRGPKLNPAVLGGNVTDDRACIMTSWWAEPDVWPDRLVWQSVSVVQCSPPEHNLFCFSDEATEFHKVVSNYYAHYIHCRTFRPCLGATSSVATLRLGLATEDVKKERMLQLSRHKTYGSACNNDLGSPVVCDGELIGLIPRGGGKKAVNLTPDYDWIMETKAELAKPAQPSDLEPEEENKHYLIQILQKLDNFTGHNKHEYDQAGDHFTQWNNQIVIPLNYVLFAMVIFFFVLLFFIILFTVVLVYYSRK